MTTEVPLKKKPLPVPNALTAPFWAAAREDRLVIQRCGSCGYYNHPPKPACDVCTSEDLKFAEMSGKGKVWARTIMHRPNVPGFENELPYLNVAVELVEQKDLLMITGLIGATLEQGQVGEPVEVTFQKVNDEITLPQFRLAR